jgi:hypothetical protein
MLLQMMVTPLLIKPFDATGACKVLPKRMAIGAAQTAKSLKRARDHSCHDAGCHRAKRFRRTDFYMEWIQSAEGNPNFAGFSKGEVLDGFSPDVDTLFNEDCVFLDLHKTYDSWIPPPPGGVLLGMDKGTVFLWPKGTKLNWIARKDGYPSEADALFAARACYTAAEAWNRALAGRIEFVYTDFFSDACFQLTYSEDLGDALAQAFGPDDYKEDLNEVIISALQLGDPKYRPKTANVLAHELGHVVGMRHAHAQEDMPGTPGHLEDNGIDSESVFFGHKQDQMSDDSIMAYTESLRIHCSDIYYMRKVYDQLSASKVTRDDSKIMKGPGLGPDGKETTVEKEIIVVAPDN